MHERNDESVDSDTAPLFPIQRQWLSATPETMARMIALKQLSRHKKLKSCQMFVMMRDETQDEWHIFLQNLYDNIHHIPKNTRMSAAIYSKIKSEAHAGDARWIEHWTAVDLLIDAHQQVHSFVLSAANYPDYHHIYHSLKSYFPQGKHYVLVANEICMDGGIPVPRVIQTQDEGSHIFALFHLNTLSNMDTHVLYHQELPQLAQKDLTTGLVIQLKDFHDTSLLAKIFLPTQSLSTLQSLSIQHTMIHHQGNRMPLSQAVQPYLTVVTRLDCEEMLLNDISYQKNLRYINKEKHFDVQFSPIAAQRIMRHKNGCLFLKNRSLFNLNAALKRIDDIQHLFTLISNIYDITRSADVIRPVSRLNELLQLCDLSFAMENIKYGLMLCMENLFLEVDGDIFCRKQLNRFVELAIFIQFDVCRPVIIQSNAEFLLRRFPILSEFKAMLDNMVLWGDEKDLIKSMAIQLLDCHDPKVRLCHVRLRRLLDAVGTQTVGIGDTNTKNEFYDVVVMIFFCLYMHNDTILCKNLSKIIEDNISLHHNVEIMMMEPLESGGMFEPMVVSHQSMFRTASSSAATSSQPHAHDDPVFHL